MPNHALEYFETQTTVDDLAERLSSCLSKVTSLKRLNLQLGQQPWAGYPSSMKHVLLASISLHSLEHFSLDGAFMNSEDLHLILMNDLGRNITTLEFHHLRVSGLHPTSTVTTSQLIPSPSAFFYSLKTLKIYSFQLAYVIVRFLADYRISKLPLRTLDLSIKSRQLESVIQSLVDLSSASIVILKITTRFGSFNPNNTSGTITSSETTKLTLPHDSLREMHVVHLEIGDKPKGIPWMLSLFSLATLPRLKTIKLDINSIFYRDYISVDNPQFPDYIPSLSWELWRNLDEILSGPT
ncbi:hypothetical protein BDN70DRAFT_931022 [Pholiota conissans]|uniref:Uncharacterized protein n=1 Tax=Pholiota conissans TaxID=109636 RepID=A0A9P5Z892_9AGAR|nr:hypothetical protein BDN70DRAFT_931022 [Pholiota conissans]